MSCLNYRTIGPICGKGLIGWYIAILNYLDTHTRCSILSELMITDNIIVAYTLSSPDINGKDTTK